MSQVLIEARSLVKNFGSKTVLDQLNFTVHAGEPVALIGPNGAGKTTLFSILCGYLTPDSGQIQLFGQQPGSAALFGKVSALPQDAQLDPVFSLNRQLQLYGQLQGMNKATAQSEANRVLQLVDLNEYANAKATMLSHGMRKRVAIAQALLGQPELVLLDEPTAGLDPANALQIRQLIAKLSEQATFVISSHNIFELERLCGTVLYLEHGKLQQHSLTQQQQQQHAAATGYLNLLLEQADSARVKTALQQLTGVLRVEQPQKNEFAIYYDKSLAVALDITVLTLLRQQGWFYRSLSQGQTLEQQLFEVASG